MEIKEENVDDSIPEVDEASGDTRPEGYRSSGESTMTCSTLSSPESLPVLDSLSDSAPDLRQPDAKSNQRSVKRNRRGRRGRKPKQLPKTSRSDDDLLKGEGAMENKDSGKRMKIMLPQKVSSEIINPNPNIPNSISSYSESRLSGDVCETISALPNLNISKTKKKKWNEGEFSQKNVKTSADICEKPAQKDDSDQLELKKSHKFHLMNKNSDIGLTDKQSRQSVESDIAYFEKKVSELCKDIKKTNLGNREREDLTTMPSTSKATSMGASMSSNLNDIMSGSASDSDLMDSAGPSSSHVEYVADSASGESMKGKVSLSERRKKIFRNRKCTIVPNGSDVSLEKQVMKLTDEIDQINAIIAKEIEKKDEYYLRGYKITHQILSHLMIEK